MLLGAYFNISLPFIYTVLIRDKNLFFLLVVNALTSLPFMFMMSMMDVTLKPFRLNEVVW